MALSKIDKGNVTKAKYAKLNNLNNLVLVQQPSELADASVYADVSDLNIDYLHGNPVVHNEQVHIRRVDGKIVAIDPKGAKYVTEGIAQAYERAEKLKK